MSWAGQRLGSHLPWVYWPVGPGSVFPVGDCEVTSESYTQKPQHPEQTAIWNVTIVPKPKGKSGSLADTPSSCCLLGAVLLHWEEAWGHRVLSVMQVGSLGLKKEQKHCEKMPDFLTREGQASPAQEKQGCCNWWCENRRMSRKLHFDSKMLVIVLFFCVRKRTGKRFNWYLNYQHIL